ncbi:MAG TPA: endonuclease/exonuclease/phosphatase family protein, partial [Thermoanaerobaculia bacterium]|nr:endonuclease/exonuclease/phosphatase family protein [Thermoanaerobaculia bacterium]
AAGTGGTAALPAPDATGGLNLAGSSGKVALVAGTAPLTGSCPAGGDLVDFVGFGSANCFEGADGTPTLSNTTAAIRRRGGCQDTDSNDADFSAEGPRPRNTASPLRDCANPGTPLAIHQIQGNGALTPYAGTEARTSGIVTARKVNGFFLQTADSAADFDPATSQAVFVFTSAVPQVAVGDAVTVVGFVTEFFNLTQLSTSADEITIHSSGNPLPAPVVLDSSILDADGTLDQLERLEGMRVHASSLTSIAASNNFGEIYTVLTGTPRPMREPGIEASRPMPAGAPCCVPRFDENPERFMVDTDGQLGATAVTVTEGVVLTNVTGPLDFTFSEYKVIPDAPPALTANRTATPVPAVGANQFTVASANLLQFDGSADRVAKTSLAFRTILGSPDVIGVQEVLTLTGLSALADRLNSDTVAAGGADPRYVAYLYEGNDIGGIDVGFLVKTSRVNVLSVEQIGKDERFPLDNSLLNDRPPVVLRATVNRDGGAAYPVTVISNHLRSLNDVDTSDRVRQKRRAQAEYLANLVQQLQSTSPTEAIVVLGDMNAFQFSDGYVDVIGTIKGVPTPVHEVVLASSDLVNPDLSNLIDALPAVQRYSYVFGGNAQVLDHMLVNDDALARVCGFAYGRLNADFPTAFAADPTRPERISDHDMPVASFSFPAQLSALTADKTVIGPVNHKMVDVNLSYSVSGGCAAPAITISVTSNEPQNSLGDGNTEADWEIVSDHLVRLRAERSGKGSDRVYTITVTATDASGASSSSSVSVTVPKGQ